ncbi:MAG: DUF5685 family protein [Lachnospiraceae bacterium]|nr:DUF5685 family protein [Lachnospiraceae bacterium]
MKDFYTYQACYCGLCHSLKNNRGQRARLVLSYDMTFVAMLLQGLYEPSIVKKSIRCPFHPLQKKQVIMSELSAYAGDMNLLLAYHNLVDDWKDDKSVKSLLFLKNIEKTYKEAAKKYPRQQKAVLTYMKKLAVCESKPAKDNIDEAANLTGIMFGEILVYKEDEWASTLRALGSALGKFIYYMDAYDDLLENEKTGAYNPLIGVSEEVIEDILKLMMAQASDCFEYLPIVEHAEILRNIIYSGVWMKYVEIKKKRMEEPKE